MWGSFDVQPRPRLNGACSAVSLSQTVGTSTRIQTHYPEICTLALCLGATEAARLAMHLAPPVVFVGSGKV